MKTPKWYSVAHFEDTLGSPYYVRGLKKANFLREKMYPGKRISRAIKNDLFIWRLISKLKFEKRETLRLREELKVLELELYNSKNSLILAKETISFYKECNKGIFESNSLLPHFKKKL